MSNQGGPGATESAAESEPARALDPRARGDIQGLRAVAILWVLLFHAGVPSMSGGYVGVDVFFVISGFLITGLVVREVDRSGRFSLAQFYARRARRLLPATAVALAAVATVTILTMPVTRFERVAGDVLASALYLVNWRFAALSVSYQHSEDAPSPVLHFWSLAVEEQFYVAWPLLLLVLLAVHERARVSRTTALLVGIATIGLPSLWHSMVLTASDPGEAWFVSTARAWELAVGAALAILGARVEVMPRAAANVLAAVGLASIAASAVVFDSSTAFPGVAATLPALGCAGVLAAGTAHPNHALARFLSVRPLQWLGALSYSLYLWHWPLLVGAAALWAKDGRTLPPKLAGVVVVAAVAPAWLTYRFVEMPLHRASVFIRRPLSALALGLACAAVGALAAGAILWAAPMGAERSGTLRAMGAAVLGENPSAQQRDWVVERADFLVPEPTRAARDTASLGGNHCLPDNAGEEPVQCEYGKTDAALVVAIVGDSKMQQWLPAVQEAADTLGWRVKTFLKGSCPLVRGRVRLDNGREWRPCALYNERRFAALLEDRSIDIVITSQRAQGSYLPGDATEAERQDAMVQDLRSTWAELQRAGKKVVVVLDNPAPTLDVLECVAKNPDRLSACAFAREEALRTSGSATQREALTAAPDVGVVNLDEYFCPGDRCPAVIGNVLVYRRGSHVTATYMKTLAPRFVDAVRDAIAGP